MKKYLAPAVVLAVLLFCFLAVIPQLLQKWLWMRQLNYAGIFWTLLSVKWGMACAAFAVTFLFFGVNVRQAAGQSFALAEKEMAPNAGYIVKSGVIEMWDTAISRRIAMRIVTLAAALVGAIFALGFYLQWDTFLRFRYGGSCGFSDPIFAIDVGFYLFRLPFYQLLQSSLTILTLLTIVGVVVPHAYFGLLRLKDGREIETWENAAGHLSPLLFILAAAFGWGYYLDRYGLLYSTMGVVYGVGYTAAHVTLILCGQPFHHGDKSCKAQCHNIG